MPRAKKTVMNAPQPQAVVPAVSPQRPTDVPAVSPFDPARLDNPVTDLLGDLEQARFMWRSLQPMGEALLTTAKAKLTTMIADDKIDAGAAMKLLGDFGRLTDQFSKATRAIVDCLSRSAELKLTLAGPQVSPNDLTRRSDAELRALVRDVAEHMHLVIVRPDPTPIDITPSKGVPV